MPMFRSDNPLDDFDQWDAERESWLARLPVCCRCNNPVQDEKLWDINGEIYCKECAEDEFEKYTDNYI